MQPNQVQRILLLWSLILLILAIGEVRPEARLRLCGQDLPETLSRICQNGFNRMVKRTFDSTELNTIEDGSVYSGYEDRSLLARMLGESPVQLMKTRPRRLGVFDECCYNTCTYSHLFRYCAAER